MKALCKKLTIPEAISEGFSLVAHELCKLREQKEKEFEWYKSHHGLATKCDLEKMGEKIMAAIQDFANQVNASFDKLGTAVDGLTSDIDQLKKKIEELQNSAGTITPADQKLLDDIQSRANGVADKLAALDALTEPPTPPVEPPTPE